MLNLAGVPGTITWQREALKATIDITFLSSNLMDELVFHERADDLDHQSDHWPLRTVLIITAPGRKVEPQRNWKETDIKVLREVVPEALGGRPLHLVRAGSGRIDLETTALLATVQRAIEKATPMTKPKTRPVQGSEFRLFNYIYRQRVDRDSGELSDLFDEQDAAVKAMLQQVISVARKANCRIGICGQAPSDHPEFAKFLVQAGINSISVSPDSFVSVRKHVAAAEGSKSS